MEQELNQFKENEFNYFKVEHKNQNVKKLQSSRNGMKVQINMSKMKI